MNFLTNLFVRGCLAGHGAAQGDRPADPSGQWIVHVSHENLLPAKRMNLSKRLRFRLFLRLVSRACGLGDEVQLSAEIMPVRVR
jgi:KUP system potassium uptake protein